MSEDLDTTLPGKAGLFFDCSQLTDAGWQQEQSARQSLERWCSYCGQSACYGFGVSLKDDGLWSCAEPSCVASVEAEIAQRNCPSPLAKPSDETATLNLFGEAA